MVPLEPRCIMQRVQHGACRRGTLQHLLHPSGDPNGRQGEKAASGQGRNPRYKAKMGKASLQRRQYDKEGKFGKR